jgi:hypothetical protein
MANSWGTPYGPTGDFMPVARASLPMGLTLTQISGGLFDVADMGSGDTQDTLTVGGVSVIDAALTFRTEANTSAHKAAREMNGGAKYLSGDYWYSIDPANADHVRIWPKNGSASVTAIVTGGDTGYTPVYGDVNTTQAFAAAVLRPSWNYGDDFFPTAGIMYQVNFDFAQLQTRDSNWTINTAKAVSLWVYPEDQIVRAYFGGEGYIRIPSAAWFEIDVLAVAQGQLNLFLQAEAATNMAYKIQVW